MTARTTADVIAELRRVHEAAPKGPWLGYGVGGHGFIICDGDNDTVCHGEIDGGMLDSDTATAVATYHNTFAALLEVAEAAARSTRDCCCHLDSPYGCTSCDGKADLRSRLDALAKVKP